MVRFRTCRSGRRRAEDPFVILFGVCIVKFSLDFRHGRQAAFQIPGQGFDQFGLPLGDADGLFQIAQRIFNGQMVTFLAQQQADGWSVIGMAQLVVHGRKVKIHLTREFRLEGFHFQINHDVAAQPEVIKQQVEIIILAADFHVILPPDKCEPDAEFEQEFLDVVEQTLFEVALMRVAADREEIKIIWVFERLLREIGLWRWQGALKVGDGFAFAFVQLRFNVVRENRA